MFIVYFKKNILTKIYEWPRTTNSPNSQGLLELNARKLTLLYNRNIGCIWGSELDNRTRCNAFFRGK